jgi:hypothetical protein
VYVVQNTSSTSSLLGFAASAGASATPTVVLNAPAGEPFGAQAVDATGNLYLGVNAATPAILVYAAGSTGNALPARTITGQSTTLRAIGAMAVDGTGQIYADIGSSILVFAANADGNAAPARVISGTATGVNFASSIAVDASGNLYVVNVLPPVGVLVFSATATGNVAPTRTILSSSLTRCFGVGVDAAGNVYAADDVPPASTILEFAAGSSGTVTPTRMLTSVSSLAIGGVAVDAQGTIYAVTVPPGMAGGAAAGTPSITVFPAGGSGVTAASATISSTSWTQSNYGQIAIQ